MTSRKEQAVAEQVRHLIFDIRGHKIILDADLAAIYGVPTEALNQAVRRNADKFSADFVFDLHYKRLQS